MTLDIGRKLSAETGIPLRQIFIDILNEQLWPEDSALSGGCHYENNQSEN